MNNENPWLTRVRRNYASCNFAEHPRQSCHFMNALVLVALFRQQPGEKFQGSTSYRKVVYIPSIYYNKASRIRRIIHTGVKQAYSILYTKAYLWRTRMTSEHPSANRNVNEVISTTLQETTQTLFFLTAGVKLTSFLALPVTHWS